MQRFLKYFSARTPEELEENVNQYARLQKLFIVSVDFDVSKRFACFVLFERPHNNAVIAE